MNASQNKVALKSKLRFAVIMLTVLIPTFFTSLVVVKSYVADVKNVKPDVTEKVESPMPQNKEPNEEMDKNQTTEQADEENEEQTSTEEKPSRKVVYLTFDDGPSKFTDQFLDILHEQDVKATFFMQGSNLQKEHLQESVKRATKEGHYVGAHSMTHEFKALYTENQFVPEMKETISIIQDITGTSPNLVRAPYGSAPGLNSEQIRNQVVDVGMKVWDWTIDSKDWALANNLTQIVENIKNGTNADIEVVLLHEKLQTLAVLPEIIAFYKEQGYEFSVYEENHHFDLNFQNDIRL